MLWWRNILFTGALFVVNTGVQASTLSNDVQNTGITCTSKRDATISAPTLLAQPRAVPVNKSIGTTSRCKQVYKPIDPAVVRTSGAKVSFGLAV
jgi:hypothetical protein